MTEQAFMLGHLCASLPHPIRGSVRRACLECRQLVWITPESLKVAGENRCVFMCVECMAGALSEDDHNVQPLTDAQKAEFNRDDEETSRDG